MRHPTEAINSDKSLRLLKKIDTINPKKIDVLKKSYLKNKIKSVFFQLEYIKEGKKIRDKKVTFW